MEMKKLFFALAALAAAACTGADDYCEWVNPKIGTGAHGHVFVGANVPFGFVQLGPTSIPQQWDWTSGYHDSDSTVIGFSHTHLSGTGIGDLFDITVMPVTGPCRFERGREMDPESGAWSYADRTREITEPGYYSVPLMRWGVTAELTATSRVGLHRYTFPSSNNAALIIDLENGGCWDNLVDSGIDLTETDAEGHITAFGGHRYSSGWARDQKIFFWAEVSRPAVDTVMCAGKYMRFNLGDTRKGEKLLMKVALSPVSVEGARANMAAELPGWDFDETRAAARAAWNHELSKVRITTSSRDRKTVFYTAMYHSLIAPSLFCDVDMQYRGSDDKVRTGDFVNYTTFSLWDTYRAQMPLMTIIHPEKMNDIVSTMYHIYLEQGDLPVWHLMGNETDCMVGNPGLISFADAVVKGFRAGLTDQEIIDAMVATATTPDRGQNLRMNFGFIPADMYEESVANDMEYAIADAALANAAEALGYEDVSEEYLSRSLSYRNYWDPDTQFMRGLRSDGTFTEPFNPLHSGRETDYTEGTAWQYLWLAPHDIEGLSGLFGSDEALLEKLDALFEAPSNVEGEDAPPDISGLIGQYAHGNEPSHHIIYIYSMLGQRDKAADRILQVCNEMYRNDVEGLAGNEDVGQMSAWYILSSLGFYQVEPASTRLWFGTPLWEKADVKVQGGTFRITAKGISDANCYINYVRLNGKPYDLPYIDYKDIVAGGTLEFIMGKKKL